jgi:hypothetical protein
MKKILLCLLSIGLSSSLYAATGDAVDSNGATMNNNPNPTTELNTGTDSDTEMDNDVDVNGDAGISTSTTTPGTNNEPAGANPGVTPGR